MDLRKVEAVMEEVVRTLHPLHGEAGVISNYPKAAGLGSVKRI